jgi:hypothetical protein
LKMGSHAGFDNFYTRVVRGEAWEANFCSDPGFMF